MNFALFTEFAEEIARLAKLLISVALVAGMVELLILVAAIGGLSIASFRYTISGLEII